MKAPQLNQTVSILANVGVIAGIIFLAFELRQNNEFLAAQARYNLIERRTQLAANATDRFMLEALHKYDSGEPTTPAERSAALGQALVVIEVWEWQYSEFRAGMLERDELPTAAWGVWYRNEGVWPVPVREVWERRRTVLNPDFVSFVEQNVIAQQ